MSVHNSLPTQMLLNYGTDEQRERFLRPMARGEKIGAFALSEPEAGSDASSLTCRAERDGDDWVLNGQKVWTSLATISDWCFVLCRTDPSAPKHQGISYLLVPMKQPGVEVRPIRQITGTSEFCEVFFDGARTAAANVVGEVNGGWQVAMGTLAFERGASTLAQQLAFDAELLEVIAAAKESGKVRDPLIRDRLAKAWIELKIMRLNAIRMIRAMQGGTLSREAMISKLYWANWHRALGELAMDAMGPAGEVIASSSPYGLKALQRLFLFSRADTIYAGSNEVQRQIIAKAILKF